MWIAAREGRTNVVQLLLRVSVTVRVRVRVRVRTNVVQLLLREHRGLLNLA